MAKCAEMSGGVEQKLVMSWVSTVLLWEEKQTAFSATITVIITIDSKDNDIDNDNNNKFTTPQKNIFSLLYL